MYTVHMYPCGAVHLHFLFEYEVFGTKRCGINKRLNAFYNNVGCWLDQGPFKKIRGCFCYISVDVDYGVSKDAKS